MLYDALRALDLAANAERQHGDDAGLVEKVHAAVLQADRAGLKRRFVASTFQRTRG
jgi:hypothetical protein